MGRRAGVRREGFQHFGEVDIDGESRAMTVRQRALDGAVLWSTALDPSDAG